MAVMALATVVIADNFRRYGGVARDPHPELTAERATAAARPEYVKFKLDDNARVHDDDLASLQAAVGPHVQPRCSGAIRAELRRAITRYVGERTAVMRVVDQEPALAAMAQA